MNGSNSGKGFLKAKSSYKINIIYTFKYAGTEEHGKQSLHLRVWPVTIMSFPIEKSKIPLPPECQGQEEPSAT